MSEISLNKQIHIYSFDTSAFYSDEEKSLEARINSLRNEKNRLKSEHEILSKLLDNSLSLQKAQSQYRALYKVSKDEEIIIGDSERISEIFVRIKGINSEVKAVKGELATLLRNHNDIRQLRKEYVVDKNIISVFESILTRTLGMETGGLYDDIMVVRTYYFDVIRDLISNGYIYNGEKYVCFTASAGQIRTKKTVFIKESTWLKYQKTLMCGLTVDSINEKGGININKYLAYLALCNSATDPWPDFDIDRSIVVEDMETLVRGQVDYIDPETYKIERREMEVPITHTDGCGMVLPSVSRDNFMVRLPWIKGLLAVFPFDKFIREANRNNHTKNHGVIKDIYGVEHDVLGERIQIIFTKSQFKMYKYYTDWQEYVKLFKKYGCTAGKCNVEDEYLPDAKLNYQMLQTLSDMTNDELRSIASRTVDRLSKIASDRQTMLEVFGATEQNQKKNSFQECLSIYPELLSDPYTKEMLRQIKKNLVKEGKSAKVDLSAKYMFLVPDLYAFCEWVFLGDTNPKGLLNNGEVSSYLYRNISKLDCLRSPHLYREHAVRTNVVNAQTRKWFSQKAIYTSCHDLISKILQFDCDGDKSLVCADEGLVNIAERNMIGIVPLYYPMAKAGAVQISSGEIYNGLCAAWTGGNIGVISNDITKIWNGDNPDIDLVKILCMENNFVIDYAKTLYKPTRPDDLNARLTSITSTKPPHFFIHAKGRDSRRVQKINGSIINQLDGIIPDKRLSFTAKNIGAFRFRFMLSDYYAHVQSESTITGLYDTVEKEYRFSVNLYDDETNYAYIRDSIIERFRQTGFHEKQICDVLVKYLFCDKQSKRKSVFWMCFGHIVFDNLKHNLPVGSVQCIRCGERFVPSAPQQKLCHRCSTYHPKVKKSVTCADCGNLFEVDARNMKKVRCDSCQKKRDREKTRERVRRHREKGKM